MGILNRIFGNRQLQPHEIHKEQRSPRSDPNHPEHYKRYWTKSGIEWSRVSLVRVNDTRVYAIYDIDGETVEDLIATRNDHRTAAGYARAVLTNLRRLNRPSIPELELNP